MGKFKSKYRIESARLKNWDYGSSGMYFITICTKNREHYFGEIVGNMASLRATEIGKITESEWLKTPKIRPDMNLELGEFVVMPNHFHGIIMIGENKFNAENVTKNGGGYVDGGMNVIDTNVINTDAMDTDAMDTDAVRTNAMDTDAVRRDAMHGVSTNTNTTETPKNKFGPQSKNLGSIVRGFKSSVTTFARKNNIEFGWQERFHDHIIRNRDEFIRISNYIVYNPENWKQDKFFN